MRRADAVGIIDDGPDLARELLVSRLRWITRVGRSGVEGSVHVEDRPRDLLKRWEKVVRALDHKNLLRSEITPHVRERIRLERLRSIRVQNDANRASSVTVTARVLLPPPPLFCCRRGGPRDLDQGTVFNCGEAAKV